MKKALSILLVFALSLSIFQVNTFARETEAAISPYYVNTTRAQIVMVIDSTGLATINSVCTAIPSTTSISAKTYIEKSVNGSWVRVDLPSIDDQWNTITFERTYSYTVTHQLTSKGLYRAVTVFTVKAATSETVTVISEATYR
jgi:hypothetical protein